MLTETQATVIFIVGWFTLSGLYLIPTWVAIHRCRLVFRVLLVNVVLGWTIMGWLIALRMATYPRPGCPHCPHCQGRP